MDESKKKDRYEDAKKFVRYSDGGIVSILLLKSYRKLISIYSLPLSDHLIDTFA